MNTVNLFAVLLVLFALGALIGSFALRVLEPVLVPRIRGFAPAVRVRWLNALMALPLASGVIGVAVAFGPCLHNLALGLADGCHDHGGPEFFFCLRTPTHDVPLAWLLAAALLLAVARRAWRASRSLVRTHRALALLKRVSRWDGARGLWVVPGRLAMVAGFPEADIFLGEDLDGQVAPATLRIVLAHERAHKERRDLLTKLVARAISTCFFDAALSERLLEELDLAMEQACDAAAAEVMKDPVLVARSLVDLARANEPPPEWAFGFGPANHLEARVRALCEPRWRSSRATLGAGIVVTVSLLAACVALDSGLHDLAEAAFGSLLGG